MGARSSLVSESCSRDLRTSQAVDRSKGEEDGEIVVLPFSRPDSDVQF